MESLDSLKLGKRKLRKAARYVVNKMVEQREENKRFFESDEFNGLIRIIKSQGSVDEELLRYGTSSIKGLDSSSFSRVCNSVFEVCERTKENGAAFPTYFVDYKGIRFYLAIGQGSAYWTEKRN